MIHTEQVCGINNALIFGQTDIYPSSNTPCGTAQIIATLYQIYIVTDNVAINLYI